MEINQEKRDLEGQDSDFESTKRQRMSSDKDLFYEDRLSVDQELYESNKTIAEQDDSSRYPLQRPVSLYFHNFRKLLAAATAILRQEAVVQGLVRVEAIMTTLRKPWTTNFSNRRVRKRTKWKRKQ